MTCLSLEEPRNMLRTLKQYVKNKKIKDYVRSLPLQGDIASEGCLTLGAVDHKNCINESSKLNHTIQNSKSLSAHFKTLGIGAALHFNDVLLYYPHLVSHIDEVIVNNIKAYLGKGAMLDAVYLGVFNTRASAENIVTNDSGLYHHDSVGNRLKLFVPINIQGNVNYPTFYMSGSQNTKWKSYANPTIGDSRLSEDILNKWVENPILVPFGGRFIFDTNGIHRGEYIVSDMYRAILQFEFSAVKNLGFGQVGPLDFNLSSDAYNLLNNYDLLRNENCKKTNDGYFHVGAAHRKNDTSYKSIKMIER